MKNLLTRQGRFRPIRAVVTAASLGVTVAMATASMAYGGSASPQPVPSLTQGLPIIGSPTAPAAPKRALAKKSAFRVATLNVLGSNHTRGRGGFASGRQRAGGEAGLIKSRHINLVGMSEVQPDQYAALAHDLPRYTVWPQGALGPKGYRLQIAWKSSRFTKVATGQTTYVFSHQRIPMPYVRLKDKRTGASFWVISTHNSPQGMQAERVKSTRIEIKVIKRLKKQHHPVLLLGDMNEHAPVYCRIARATRMVSADGGYWRHGCHTPRPTYIDWIMGTRNVGFSHYTRDTTTRSRGLSDHPLYYSDANVTDRG